MSLSRELITQRRLAYQSCCVTLQYESSSCKYLSVSAWTQSVDRKAGPTFLSMSRILMSGLEFSSWRSSRSCFERLFLQCEFQPRSSFATLREAWRVCPQDLGFPWMESSWLERIIWGRLANLSWRRTLRQKSWICWLNWGTVEGRKEGLNFRPSPRTLDCRLVSSIEVKLWISLV